MRCSVKSAGIQRSHEDSEGPVWTVDFHATRTTYGTMAGKQARSVSELMGALRVTDPRLATDTYNDLRLVDNAGLTDSLPNLTDDDRVEGAVAMRTGTDDLPVEAVTVKYMSDALHPVGVSGHPGAILPSGVEEKFETKKRSKSRRNRDSERQIGKNEKVNLSSHSTEAGGFKSPISDIGKLLSSFDHISLYFNALATCRQDNSSQCAPACPEDFGEYLGKTDLAVWRHPFGSRVDPRQLGRIADLDALHRNVNEGLRIAERCLAFSLATDVTEG